MGSGSSSNSNKVLIIGSIGIDQTTFNKDIPKYGEINVGKIIKNPVVKEIMKQLLVLELGVKLYLWELFGMISINI